MKRSRRVKANSEMLCGSMLDSRPLLLVALTPDGVTMDKSFSDFAMIGAFLNMAKLPLRAGLVFWLFLLSAIAFLDRTNISIVGPQISHEYGVGNVWLGWIISPFLIGYGHPKCWLGGLLYGSGREASLPWECCGGAHSRFRPR